jgi:hypothetical protein
MNFRALLLTASLAGLPLLAVGACQAPAYEAPLTAPFARVSLLVET